MPNIDIRRRSDDWPQLPVRAARKLNRHVIFKSLFAKHYQIIGPYLSKLQRAKKLAHSVHRQLVVGPNCQAGSVAQRCPASLPGSLLVAAVNCCALLLLLLLEIANSIIVVVVVF